MIIRKIILENFISHEHTEIHFTQGVNVILGHNGAGKSSIIEAIKLVLMEKYRGKYIQDLVKRGKRNSSVEMDFWLEGKEYSILRTINIGKSSQKGDAVLKCEGTLIAQTIKGVSDAMSELLHIRKDVLMNSVFVEQGQIDSLISSEKAERERTFSSILSLDTLSECASSLKEYISALSHEIDAVPYSQEILEEKNRKASEIKGRVSSLNTELIPLMEELASTNKNKEGLSEVKNKLEAEKTRLLRLDQSMQSEIRQKAGYMSDLGKKEKELAENRKQLQSLTELLYPAVHELEKEIEAYLSVSGNTENLVESLRDYNSQIEAIDEKIRDLDSLKEAHEKFISLENRLSEARKELEETQDEWVKYESAKKEISTLEEATHQMECKVSELIKAIRTNLQLAEGSEIDIPSELKAAEEERSKISNEKSILAGREASDRTRAEEISRNISELEGRNQCPVCQQPLTPDHVKELMEEYDRTLSQIKSDLKIIDERKEKIRVIESGINYRVKYLNSPEVRSLGNLEISLDANLKRIHDAEETIERSKLMAEKHIALRKTIAELEAESKSMAEKNRNYEQALGFLQSHNRQDLGQKASKVKEQLRQIENARSSIAEKLSFSSDRDLKLLVERYRNQNIEMNKITVSIKAIEATIKDLQDEISGLSGSIERASAEVHKLDQVTKSLEETERKIEENRNQLIQVSTRIASIKATLESNEDNLRTIRSEILEIEESVSRKRKMLNQVEVLKRMRECFDRDGIQRQIRKSATEFITNRMRDYISAFGLRFDDVVVGDDMDISVQIDGSVEPLLMLSGGERTAISIGLRLALARYLSENINTIIMDEPTNFLDEDRRNSLKDIIQNAFMTERIVPQMIIVTHHPELAAAADSTFMVSKVDGNSVVETE